uniref:Uncharacterized protein n=1 Tax=Sphaerodactylus townsendi TaxID=933632 RepID=A0ACB8F6H6_9SAUR
MWQKQGLIGCIYDGSKTRYNFGVFFSNIQQRIHGFLHYAITELDLLIDESHSEVIYSSGSETFILKNSYRNGFMDLQSKIKLFSTFFKSIYLLNVYEKALEAILYTTNTFESQMRIPFLLN